MDLYSIGEMVIDFTPGKEPASYIRNPGGAPANVAIAMAKNDLETGVCCSLGDDDFGRFLKETLEEHGVRRIISRLCQEAVTTMAFVTLSPDGDRSFTFARKPGADMFIQEEDVREEDIRESVIIHAGSCSLSASPAAEATVRALRLGREMGKLVSFDVNYRDVMWKGDQDACAAKVTEILPYVDLVKISDAEAGMLGGEGNIPEMMKRYGLTAVVETMGGDGARCYFNDKVLFAAAVKGNCVDATGAGDAFWGGFLSYLRIQDITEAGQLTEELLTAALAYGNAAGGICVQGMGAIPSLPTRQQIEAHLASN